MDRVPPEIWHKIYAGACTDGGPTGRALAQVSRYIRATSQEYRLQSVMLRGHKQAIAFAIMLDNTPTQDRKIVDLRVHLDDDETLLPYNFPVAASMSESPLCGRFSTIEMFNWQVRDLILHFRKKRKCSTAESNIARALVAVKTWELWEQRRWRTEQYETELITAVQHILLHLHPSQTLLTLTIGSNHTTYALSRLCSAWLSHIPKLESLKIHYPRPQDCIEPIISIDGIDSSPTSLQYLDLSGVYFRRTPYCNRHIKKDRISGIVRLVPSLVYLRLNIGAVLTESLPVSEWLFDDVQGVFERSASLPRTVKMVFFQYELQENEASGSELRWYRSCEDSLRLMAVHEPRFEVVDFCDRALSLEQLVDRLE
ncbi:hypothetical protein HWV62_12190 [Athelia sp. TMB]|nr:hypothetical protein HWV62_12190 [Athelia sp. TMB]